MQQCDAKGSEPERDWNMAALAQAGHTTQRYVLSPGNVRKADRGGARCQARMLDEWLEVRTSVPHR